MKLSNSVSNLKNHPIPKLFNILGSLKYFLNYCIIEWLMSVSVEGRWKYPNNQDFYLYFHCFLIGRYVNPKENWEISQGYHYRYSKPTSTLCALSPSFSISQVPILIFNAFFRHSGPDKDSSLPFSKLFLLLTLYLRKKKTIPLKVWFLPAI